MRVTITIRDDLNTKNQRVLKAADMVESQRIEWDKNLKAIPAALCPYAAQRHKTATTMTFVADRSLDTGHTEAFRAIPPTDILGIRLGDLPAIDTAYPQR